MLTMSNPKLALLLSLILEHNSNRLLRSSVPHIINKGGKRLPSEKENIFPTLFFESNTGQSLPLEQKVHQWLYI